METMKTIPFVAYEAEMTRQERKGRRLWILAMFLIGALVLTNTLWIIKVVI